MGTAGTPSAIITLRRSFIPSGAIWVLMWEIKSDIYIDLMSCSVWSPLRESFSCAPVLCSSASPGAPRFVQRRHHRHFASRQETPKKKKITGR